MMLGGEPNCVCSYFQCKYTGNGSTAGSFTERKSWAYMDSFCPKIKSLVSIKPVMKSVVQRKEN